MNGHEIEFDWDEANVRHVARHSVLPDEAEHVILNDPVDLGMDRRRGGAPPQPRFDGEGPRSSRGDHMARRSRMRRNGVRAHQAAHSVLLRGKREVIHKMAKKQPHFETETQEAEWWARNQDLILNRFRQAKALGKLGKGTVARVAGERAKQAGASPTITIRLAEDDLVRARTLAAEKGLRYQTYIKMLLHQALNSEEHNAKRL